MKKNDMESEEEKKMQKARCKANIIVIMATINIKMVAMDSSVFSSCVLFPDEYDLITEKQQVLRACYQKRTHF